MKYFTVHVSNSAGISTYPDGEAIGIAAVPLWYTSWVIYHGKGKNVASWCKPITKSQYETYEAFGFIVYNYSKIGPRKSHVKTIYDPSLFVMKDGHLVTSPSGSKTIVPPCDFFGVA